MEQQRMSKPCLQTSRETVLEDSAIELISQKSDQEKNESHQLIENLPHQNDLITSQLSNLNLTNSEKDNLVLSNQFISKKHRDSDACVGEPKKSPQKKQATKSEQKLKKTNNQRQSKMQQFKNDFPISKQSKKQATKQEYEDEWTIQSDEEENQLEGENGGNEDINLKEQHTAILEDSDIKDLSVLKQEDQLNKAYIQKQATLKYQHWLQNKYLLVLYLVFRKEIYEMFPNKTSNRIDIHPSNKNKIIIFGTSHEQIKQISTQISQFINKIAIVKLNIRDEEATRLKSSKTLNERLLREKLVIFKYGNVGEKSFYIGGKGSQPQLSNVFKELRCLKFRYLRMFDFRNTRSYKIFIGYFIKQKELLKGFSKWSLKNIEIVPYIPTFNKNNPKKDKQKFLCLLITTVGHLQNLSPKQIEHNLSSFIQQNCYSVVLIFRKGQKYLPKLSVEGITFKYVFQKRFSWAYLYIMSSKKQFFIRRDQMIKEVEKLSQKNQIFGARFFDSLIPQKSQCNKPESCKQIRFPEYEPYSTSFITKMKTQTKLENEAKSEGLAEQRIESGWEQFDWKAHLLSFKEGQSQQKC